MDRDQLQRRVAAWLREGRTLTEIQNLIREEFGSPITFLELRLLASELEGVD